MAVEAKSLVPTQRIQRAIVALRGETVMLDGDLAELYEVETRVLNQAVKRNLDRFPRDFMFQLTSEEWADLKSQFVTSSSAWGGRRTAPYAFTEQGVAMLSSVLRSDRAVQVNIEIMRAFVALRQMSERHTDLVRKIKALERNYDQKFRIVFEAIRELMAPPVKKKRPIGFRRSEQERKDD